jgi:hypothetical protein
MLQEIGMVSLCLTSSTTTKDKLCYKLDRNEQGRTINYSSHRVIICMKRNGYASLAIRLTSSEITPATRRDPNTMPKEPKINNTEANTIELQGTIAKEYQVYKRQIKKVEG